MKILMKVVDRILLLAMALFCAYLAINLVGLTGLWDLLFGRYALEITVNWVFVIFAALFAVILLHLQPAPVPTWWRIGGVVSIALLAYLFL